MPIVKETDSPPIARTEQRNKYSADGGAAARQPRLKTAMTHQLESSRSVVRTGSDPEAYRVMLGGELVTIIGSRLLGLCPLADRQYSRMAILAAQIRTAKASMAPIVNRRVQALKESRDAGKAQELQYPLKLVICAWFPSISALRHLVCIDMSLSWLLCC